MTERTEEERRRVSGPGLRTFLNIADRWGLTDDERLATLGLERAVYDELAAKALAGGELTLPIDTLMRISGILGVHKGLTALFGDLAEEVAWLRGPHGAFGGRPPIELMTNEGGILAVRRHLEQFHAQRAAIDALEGLGWNGPPRGSSWASRFRDF